MSQYINYGIDLGTTNSCIAHWNGGSLRVMQSADQMNVTPSVVRVLKTGSLLVGLRAYNGLVTDPDNVAAEFKRLMGQKYRQEFPASGRALSPEELSAEVLKSLLNDARRHTGEEVRASVITVPAAFTTLMCEATARAARLAGLEEFPLLQEPIAAAIAYGASADLERGQRWLVFDLGGGTLDVAVISTRDGRLNVLEHRGDNHLGGKDLDRLVVQNIFLPILREQFSLPGSAADAPQLARLVRQLNSLAERAKIELSTADQTIVSFLDLGDDDEGTPIETDYTLTRAELEREVEPLVERCVKLAEEALAGARTVGRELDRILLVGGPTQMPYLRQTIGERLGARVDFSLDPMTVVACGAALYGSTIERQASSAIVAVREEKAEVRLAYEPVSEALQTPVAGKFHEPLASRAREVKIDAEDGYWTSGWHGVEDGYFEIAVTLQAGKSCAFRLSVRDAEGRLCEVEPATFQLRHGLVISAPPLPHTISVEVTKADGTIELNPVFPRMTPLPAEKTVSYRAARTLRPSEAETSLAIKLWEGEALSEPQANTWVGNMHIRSDYVRRPVPEGAEIQLHIRVDASRLITVEVFIPHLNEHFTNRIYIPQEEEPDYVQLAETLAEDLEGYLSRLNRLEEHLIGERYREEQNDMDFPAIVFADGEADETEEEAGRGLRGEVERLRREIEDFDIEIILQDAASPAPDPDVAKGLVERSRQFRVRLVNLEREAGINLKTNRLAQATELAAEIEQEVESYGTETQRERFAALHREMKRAASVEDARGVQRVIAPMKNIRRQILHSQPWFWREWLEYFQRPHRRFVNAEAAEKWLAHGAEGLAADDQGKIEEAVRRLWELQPVEEQAADKERALRPGLKL